MKIVIIFLMTFILSQPSFAAMPHRHHQMSQEGPQEDYAFSGELKEGVREITVEAFRYGFKPDPIVIKFNEKVRLLASVTDVTHGLMISEFKINTPLRKGQPKKIEFIADKKGSFIIHCSVYCGTGHSRMHGRLIVK